jgi:hypothetical protein
MVIGEAGEPGAGVAAARDGYRSSRVLSRWLVGTLLLGLALTVATESGNALVALRHPRLLDPEVEFTGPGELTVALGLLLGSVAAVLVFVLCVVLFCVWVHRAIRNAAALGARAMEFTPGWAVGWFFVPFANLVKPYQVVREIYQASDPDRDEEADESLLTWEHWSAQPAPVQAKIWWGTWILMNVLQNISLRFSLRDDAAYRTLAAWVGVAASVVAVPCTLLVIWVILEIDDRQERRHARQPGPLPDRASAS